MTVNTGTDADGAADEPIEDPAGAPEVEPGSAPPESAGDAATPTEGPGDEAEDHVLQSFRLEDIEDPEVRAQVELYTKQVQGDYTRKTQSLAQQRKELEASLATIDKLKDEDTRIEALQALADEYGLELELESDAEDEQDDPGDPTLDAQIEALQARLDARDTAEAEAQLQAEQELYKTQVITHVDQALATLAKARGLKDESALPARMRRRVIQNAAALPAGEDGMPDMATAITEYEAEEAEAVQAYLKSKQGVTADLSGSSGQSAFDPSNERERLNAMNRIAAAAIARHA